MDLSNLSPGKRRNRKRVGRGPGSGNGKTSGKGHKGQKSRSGYSRRAGFEGGQMPLMRRIPKRGFHNENRHAPSEVNLDVLDKNFDSGEVVTQQALLDKHLIKKRAGGIKVLGRGELTKPLMLSVNAISESARAKVESAGGSIAVIEAPPAKAARKPKPRKTKPAPKGA